MFHDNSQHDFLRCFKQSVRKRFMESTLVWACISEPKKKVNLPIEHVSFLCVLQYSNAGSTSCSSCPPGKTCGLGGSPTSCTVSLSFCPQTPRKQSLVIFIAHVSALHSPCVVYRKVWNLQIFFFAHIVFNISVLFFFFKRKVYSFVGWVHVFGTAFWIHFGHILLPDKIQFHFFITNF